MEKLFISKTLIAFCVLATTILFSVSANSAGTYTQCILDLHDGRQVAVQDTDNVQSCDAKARQCATDNGWQVQRTQFNTGNVYIDWNRQGGQALICSGGFTPLPKSSTNTLPSGSYTHSCVGCEMHGRNLTCSCDGKQTSINTGHCPDGTICNNRGQLRCDGSC